MSKKPVNKSKVAVSIMILVFVGIIGWGGVIFSESDIIRLRKENADYVKRCENYVKINTQLIQNVNSCQKEMDTLKERLNGIKDGEDLLRRDIFLYIDKKFQLIPNTLAADIAMQIIEQSKNANVSPELVVGIIEVESSFNPMAVSSKNARGLMQVMPEWAKKFGLKKVTDLHDVGTNIQSGIKVLQIHIDEEKGNITKGLYRYVGGSESYADKVYASMGKFVAFRSTIDDDEKDIVNGDKPEDEQEIKPNTYTEGNPND
jgi:hypothetical protein